MCVQIDLRNEELSLIVTALRGLCSEYLHVRLLAIREYSDDKEVLKQILLAVDEKLYEIRKVIARLLLQNRWQSENQRGGDS